MYYSSSDSSDSENQGESGCLDFSYLLMDSHSLSSHLNNSIQEQNIHLHHKTRREEDNKTLDSQSYQGVRSKPPVNPPTEHLKDLITRKLQLQHNALTVLPFELTQFSNLKVLNISNNHLFALNDFLLTLVHLEYLIAKHNMIGDDGLPKEIAHMTKLKEINLSGNSLTVIPPQLFGLANLKYLSCADNQITGISKDIKKLTKLRTLNLGGNSLTSVPDEVGNLSELGLLSLCDNKIRRLPRAISKLTSLKSLLLHKNNLCCLPVEIIKVQSLTEISLRDNPLVARFVKCCAKEIIYTPPTLLELAARVIKLNNFEFTDAELPLRLKKYLNSGQSCVNPQCKGMYFSSCVEHIKFVDFCGMYRVPLMHYLCSSRCSSNGEASDPSVNLQRVLLG